MTRKLDLACGQSPREGFEGVDIWDGAQHVVDLQKFPWPFEDNSVAELSCSHYVEHIPACNMWIDPPGNAIGPQIRKDCLFAFFDECHRILVPDGLLYVIVPCGRSNRAFQDPTHRRFIVEETFLYLSDEWRKLNKLDHYNVKCNFKIDVQRTVSSELNALHEAAQARHLNNFWNTVVDLHARLIKI